MSALLTQLELGGQKSTHFEKTVTESCTYTEGEGREIHDCCRQKVSESLQLSMGYLRSKGLGI